MHNWLNTGTQKQNFYKDTVISCHVCCSDTETWQHMFRCNHKDSIAVCTLAFTKFKSALIKMNAAPILHQVLVYNVSQWCTLTCGTPPCLSTDLTGSIVHNDVET
eukprot:6491708-Ditylum_brightwellii.AAC.1